MRAVSDAYACVFIALLEGLPDRSSQGDGDNMRMDNRNDTDQMAFKPTLVVFLWVILKSTHSHYSTPS